MPIDSTTNGRDAAATDIALIEEFCAQAEVAALTRVKYRTQLEEFREWLAHPRTPRRDVSPSMCDASRPDVVRFMAYLVGGERYAARRCGCTKDALSPSTRKSFLASLHNFYTYLVAVELVQRDPTAGVPRPKVTTKPGMRLTVEELRRLLAAPGSPRDRVQVYLLAFTAARLAEIRGLRWKDINFVEGTITLHGKGDKYRIISIHPRLMPELRRWYLKQDDCALRYPAMLEAKADPDTDFVLMTSNGRPMPTNGISKQLKARAVRAGLHVLEPRHGDHRSRISPHALRRTFATLLLNDGHHLDAVADVLGHASVDTTRNHYAFSSNERRRATIDGFHV